MNPNRIDRIAPPPVPETDMAHDHPFQEWSVGSIKKDTQTTY
jgi:hypothetical protein